MRVICSDAGTVDLPSTQVHLNFYATRSVHGAAISTMDPVAVYAFSTILILLPTEKQQKIGFDTVINTSAGTAIFQVLDAVREILPRTRAASENPHTGVATLVIELALLAPPALWRHHIYSGPSQAIPLAEIKAFYLVAIATPTLPTLACMRDFAALFPLERVV